MEKTAFTLMCARVGQASQYRRSLEGGFADNVNLGDRGCLSFYFLLDSKYGYMVSGIVCLFSPGNVKAFHRFCKFPL